MPPPTNASEACGRWDFGQLRELGVHTHVDEWSAPPPSSPARCCKRRDTNPWAPDVEAPLRPKSVKLLIVLASDSRNATRAQVIANIGAFSMLHAARATFVVVVGRCERWSDVTWAASLFGVPFECCLLYTSPSPRDS